MDFALTEEQKMVQKMARDFAEKEIAPYVDQDEENHYWRREIFDKMADLGLFGFCIDEKYGGNGMGFLEGALVIEQVAKVHTSWRMAFNMQDWGHVPDHREVRDRGAEEVLYPQVCQG